jgi:SH3 domain protein
MHSLPARIGAIVLGAVLATGALAQDRYIEDTVFVPLRASAGGDQRIVHKGLPSGTAVTVVEENRDSGWALVRTREGLEGWLQSRYLKREPGARWQIGNALRLLGQPDDGSVTLTAAIEQSRAQLDALTAERDKLQAELAEGRQLWTHSEDMDAANRQLTEQVQVLKSRIEVLEADNLRLRDESWQKWFINGVWATGVGGLLTLLLPRLLQRRRRYSEWA